MSETSNSGVAANGASPQFTERELQLLGWAMQSLKSGPPEIDYDKLAAFASMSNPRSASNAWAKIKVKLNTTSPDGAALATPKKGGAKKKAAKEDNGEEGEGTPKKTPRKRVAKKQDVDGDSSPKKKGARGKKASSDEVAKEGSDEDLSSNVPPVKAEPVEEDIEDSVA